MDGRRGERGLLRVQSRCGRAEGRPALHELRGQGERGTTERVWLHAGVQPSRLLRNRARGGRQRDARRSNRLEPQAAAPSAAGMQEVSRPHHVRPLPNGSARRRNRVRAAPSRGLPLPRVPRGGSRGAAARILAPRRAAPMPRTSGSGNAAVSDRGQSGQADRGGNH